MTLNARLFIKEIYSKFFKDRRGIFLNLFKIKFFWLLYQNPYFRPQIIVPVFRVIVVSLHRIGMVVTFMFYSIQFLFSFNKLTRMTTFIINGIQKAMIGKTDRVLEQMFSWHKLREKDSIHDLVNTEEICLILSNNCCSFDLNRVFDEVQGPCNKPRTGEATVHDIATSG